MISLLSGIVSLPSSKANPTQLTFCCSHALLSILVCFDSALLRGKQKVRAKLVVFDKVELKHMFLAELCSESSFLHFHTEMKIRNFNFSPTLLLCTRYMLR